MVDKKKKKRQNIFIDERDNDKTKKNQNISLCLVDITKKQSTS